MEGSPARPAAASQQQEPAQAGAEGQGPAQQLLASLSAPSSAESLRPRSEVIAELRQKWAKPTDTIGKIKHVYQKMMFRSDFSMGAYFFDAWEVWLVYPVFFMLLVLVVFGIGKQAAAGWDLALKLAQRLSS